MFRATHTPPLSVLLDDLLTKTLKRWMPPTRHHGPRYRKSLECENAMLRTRIAGLEAIGDFGAANAARHWLSRHLIPV